MCKRPLLQLRAEAAFKLVEKLLVFDPKLRLKNFKFGFKDVLKDPFFTGQGDQATRLEGANTC